MSSIKPNDGRGELDGGEKVALRLVVAGGDGAELLELGEEVLDQVTCLEEVSVIVAANLPVCLGRDDRGLAGGGQWGEDTFISIEGLVGDDGIGLHGWQEVIGAEQIVRLTSGQVAAWLAENGLALHPDKMRIGDSREPGMGFDFLGYRFEAGQRLVRKKSLMALKDKVRSRTGRSRGVSLGRIIDDLNPILRGWFGYFQHATPGVFRAIDGLVRRRLRAILRKQEKRPGFGRCRADHQRWPNAFFAERGLFTLQTAHAQARHSR